jgi:hypothetical protein
LWSVVKDYSLAGLDEYPAFSLDDEKPSGPLLRNVKPGIISISHFRIIIGLNIFSLR